VAAGFSGDSFIGSSAIVFPLLEILTVFYQCPHHFPSRLHAGFGRGVQRKNRTYAR
jgi:hypothetical protein